MILWRVSNGVMSVFFFLAGFVQRNDPDSLLWMTVYLIPAVICLAYALNLSDIFLVKELTGVHIAASLVIAVYTFIQLTEALSDGSGLLLHELEESRELAGSCFVVSWLLLNVKYMYSDAQNKRKLSRLMAVVSFMPILLWSSAHFSTDYQAKIPEHCKTAFKAPAPTIITMSE